MKVFQCHLGVLMCLPFLHIVVLLHMFVWCVDRVGPVDFLVFHVGIVCWPFYNSLAWRYGTCVEDITSWWLGQCIVRLPIWVKCHSARWLLWGDVRHFPVRRTLLKSIEIGLDLWVQNPGVILLWYYPFAFSRFSISCWDMLPACCSPYIPFCILT